MERATQRVKLLEHMEQYGPITSIEATKKYNILRPSNRIQELKEAGYDVRTEIVWKKREDGSVTHYARYSLEA